VTTVVCVLRSGGVYRPAHVARLRDQVRQHGAELTCMTDMPEVLGVVSDVRALRGDELRWPGWWAKVAALKLPGPILYLDLDVNVVSDLTPLLEAAERSDLLMVESMWGPDDPNRFNSSVMGWRADAPRALHELFASDPQGHMARHSKLPQHRATWGDQGFIYANFQGSITAWDDVLPGAVLSYKRGALLGKPLDRCIVLASHGSPKPWEAGGADAWLAARARVGVGSAQAAARA
jgi:hypothetical protein